MAKADLTAARLRELLHYDPDTGVFTWRVSRGRVSKGTEAGTADRHGYRMIRLFGVRYFAHRLAWLYIHGVNPASCMDHANGDPADNRIVNLREATHAQNNQNQRVHTRNASGLIGAWWNSKKSLWESSISVSNVKIKLGYFRSKEDAHAAYLRAKLKHHHFNPVQRITPPS